MAACKKDFIICMHAKRIITSLRFLASSWALPLFFENIPNLCSLTCFGNSGLSLCRMISLSKSGKIYQEKLEILCKDGPNYFWKDGPWLPSGNCVSLDKVPSCLENHHRGSAPLPAHVHSHHPIPPPKCNEY